MFTEVQYQAKLQCVGVRWLTSAAQRVGGAQTVVSWLAAVTAGTLYIHFALTGSCAVITPAAVRCPLGTADTAWRQRHQHGLSTNVQCDLESETWYTEMLGGISLTYAGIRTIYSTAGVWLVSWSALVTLWPCGVVHTIFTHASTPLSTGLIQRPVKPAALCVVVTLTTWGQDKTYPDN